MPGPGVIFTIHRPETSLRYPNGREIVKVVNFPVDKEILKKIAKSTDARFFEAQDKEGLASIYDEIDLLEKSDAELSVNAIFEELFAWPLALALSFLLLEIILSRTLFLRIP